MTQRELYLRVREIKKNVLNVTGGRDNLPDNVRESNEWVAYFGTCLEVADMFADNELTEEAVNILNEYGDKVIKLYNNGG